MNCQYNIKNEDKMKIKPLLSSMLTLSFFISLSTQASVITQIKPNYVSSNYAQTKYVPKGEAKEEIHRQALRTNVACG